MSQNHCFSAPRIGRAKKLRDTSGRSNPRYVKYRTCQFWTELALAKVHMVIINSWYSAIPLNHCFSAPRIGRAKKLRDTSGRSNPRYVKYRTCQFWMEMSLAKVQMVMSLMTMMIIKSWYSAIP